MLAGAHCGVPAFAPAGLAGLAVGLGCVAAADPVGVAWVAGAEEGVDVGVGVGLAHALPYATVGSACRLFSAATDCRAAAAARSDGG